MEQTRDESRIAIHINFNTFKVRVKKIFWDELFLIPAPPVLIPWECFVLKIYVQHAWSWSCRCMWSFVSQGLVAQNIVSANHWLRTIKTMPLYGNSHWLTPTMLWAAWTWNETVTFFLCYFAILLSQNYWVENEINWSEETPI